MQENKEIYFDNSATTKICRAALDTYTEVSLSAFGNPSSRHRRGKQSEDLLREVRRTVAASVGMPDAAVIFTASGSEANNLAILGRARAKDRFKHAKILTTEGEHASVDLPLAEAERMGMQVEKLPTKGGAVDLTALEAALTPDTVLCTFMMINNETGACYDIAALAHLVHRKCPNCVLHCDATQSYMKIPVDMKRMGIDMLTVSSHKIEGPKGVGALIVSPRLLKEKGIIPLIYGGGQESGLRSGTENVPGIAAFGAAIAYQKEHFAAHHAQLECLRAHLLSRLQSEAAFAEVRPLCPVSHAPHILNLILPRIKSEVMLNFLSGYGISVSSGSACSSHDAHISHALTAFGLSAADADCGIRVSFSHENTVEEVDCFCEVLAEGLARLARKR